MVERTYSTRLVALAVDVDPRWLDNLLSRHQLPGVSRTRRGVERRIADSGLLAIELTRILNLELGVSLENAAEISRTIVRAPDESHGRFQTPSGLILEFPLDRITLRLRQRLGDAVEFIAQIPRGRPRSTAAEGE